jgi:hypothetical protein
MANTVTMMKKDAVINIQIGTGFLQRMQQVVAGLASEHTEEELDAFHELVKKGQTEFSEEWMDHLFILSAFVHLVEKEAISQGATFEKEVDTPSTEEN